MVKGTEFGFDVHACSQGQSGHDTLNLFLKGGVTRVTRVTWPPKIHMAYIYSLWAPSIVCSVASTYVRRTAREKVMSPILQAVSSTSPFIVTHVVPIVSATDVSRSPMYTSVTDVWLRNVFWSRNIVCSWPFPVTKYIYSVALLK